MFAATVRVCLRTLKHGSLGGDASEQAEAVGGTLAVMRR